MPLSVQRDAYIAFGLDGCPVAARKIDICGQNKAAAGRHFLKIIRTSNLNRIFTGRRNFCQKLSLFGKSFQRCTGLFKKAVTSHLRKITAQFVYKVIGICLGQ